MDEEPRVKRRDRRSEVTKTLHAGLDDVGTRSEGFPVLEAVVTVVWLGEAGVSTRSTEVKATAIDDDATDCRSVATNKFGC